jgi:ATP synthase, Delta/Epsilon chain, beta-sandwich domain
MLASEKGMKSKLATGEGAYPSNGVFVDLMTPKGKVFSGRAAAVRFSPAHTVVQFEPGAVSYFGLINSGELVLRTGNKFQFFAILRGSASIRGRRLTVLAETITPVTAPFENCGNLTCDCGDTILDHPYPIPRSSVLARFRTQRERHGKSSATSARAARRKKKQ